MEVHFFRNKENKKVKNCCEIKKIRDIEEWKKTISPDSLGEWEDLLTEIVLKTEEHKIKISGYCDVCNKKVDFLLDDLYCPPDSYTRFDDPKPLTRLCFRERMTCSECGLNSRQRALFKLLPHFVNTKSKIYMLEQVTPSFHAISSKYPYATGSEYLGDEFEPGFINENGIRHEDASQLSFPDCCFDCVISQDVFEHVFDIESCLREIYRVLKPKGNLIISVPFYALEPKTRKRAEMTNGEVKHFLEPVYHGNPVGDGSLLVYDYGWDLLKMIKK